MSGVSARGMRFIYFVCYVDVSGLLWGGGRSENGVKAKFR